MNLSESIQNLKQEMSHSGVHQEEGLGTELFHFASTLMPVINVDIIVTNQHDQILLSWRDDSYTGVGWHVPGRCIRFGEYIHDAIQKCAEEEIHTTVNYDSNPLTVMEFITHDVRPIEDQRERAHFITLPYKCLVPDGYIIDNGNLLEHDRGYLKWFNNLPDDLYPGHECYRKIWESIRKGESQNG